MEAVEEPEVDDVLALRDAIDEVLKRLREGYEREDIELYMSAFWEDGFRYVSDLGTDVDRRDDVVFDNLRLERDAAKGTFARFQDIRLELSQPPHIMDIRENRLDAMNHYRLVGFANDGEALVGGFLAWFAEGDTRLTFERRNGEWRIARWIDEAFNEEEVVIANNINPAKEIQPGIIRGVHPRGKLATMWGLIKVRF